MTDKFFNIKTREQLHQVIGPGFTSIIFKHSTRCPISATALEEFKKFAENESTCKLAYIDVIEARDIANAVESKSGVRHASPQALLFKDGKAIWNASHDNITVASLKNALLTN